MSRAAAPALVGVAVNAPAQRRQRPTLQAPTSHLFARTRHSVGRAGGVVGAAIASGRVDDATLPGPLEPTASSSGQEAASWPLDAEGRVLIKCLRFSELRHFLTTIGIRSDRAGHVWRWIYKHRINSWDDAQGTSYALARGIREALARSSSLGGGLQLKEVHAASDGTRKLVFTATEGPARGLAVESVLIPMAAGATERRRFTLCVSSQVGCAMGCKFCFTGKLGLLASLLPCQIVEQLVQARKVLEEADDPTPVSHVVYMGMGEPLHNYDAVLASLDIMTSRDKDADGLNVSAGGVTVSTVGLVPEMRRFVHDTQGRSLLAVSLHVASDEVRSRIVPNNKRYPLSELIATMEDLYPHITAALPPPQLIATMEDLFPRDRKDRFCVVEYTLLQGVNDSQEDAERLVKLLAGVRCIVNLIVYNPHNGAPFQRTPPETTAAFRDTVRRAKIVCTVRESKGDDEMAACGQLGGEQMAQGTGRAGRVARAVA